MDTSPLHSQLAGGCSRGVNSLRILVRAHRSKKQNSAMSMKSLGKLWAGIPTQFHWRQFSHSSPTTGHHCLPSSLSL